MGRNFVARAAIIALLWMASFAVVPADWGTRVSAPLRVLPFLDPTAGVIGIAARALIKGLVEFNTLVRLIFDAQQLAAILTGPYPCSA